MSGYIGAIKTTAWVTAEMADDLIGCGLDGLHSACGGDLANIEVVNWGSAPEGISFLSEVVAIHGGTLNLYIDGEAFSLSRTRWLQGLQKYCDRFATTPDEVYENHDVVSAGSILQFALFGEEVYG